jgi:hypothetical protein
MKSRSVNLPMKPELVEALREISPCGSDDAPTVIKGWRSHGRHWRRIVAEYPSGWKLRVNFDRHGNVSSASSHLSLVVRAAKP